MAVKFSVLLPTRNGGRFLAACVRSILDQGYSDLELIVSDNANTDETPDVVRTFSDDKRVVPIRVSHPISVTENWNNALAASTGKYIVMMGDDDYMLPGYFSRMDRALRQHDEPDVVLHNGYSFVARGSINGNSESYYREMHFSYGRDLREEQVVSPVRRFGIVRDMFRFTLRIPLNMQTALISRRAIDRIGRPIFKPPFPDHYALNALLLIADKWVFLPDRLVVVGISPKSFGHYVYSNQDRDGLAYLGVDSMPGTLPGSALINGTYVWLCSLKRDFPDLLIDECIDRACYVRRQVYAWLIHYLGSAITTREIVGQMSLLSTSDWVGLLSSAWDTSTWRRVFLAFARLLRIPYFGQSPLRPLPSIATIDQFASWLASRARRTC